jgi:HSP20 family protein
MKLVKHEKEKAGRLAPISSRWSPMWPLSRLQSDIDRLFEPLERWFLPTAETLETWAPAIDVYEDKDTVFVKAELPGMKKEEIEVSVRDEMLHISGERKEETEYKGAETYRAERYFGRFYRSMPLPVAVEENKIEAHYENGVLTIKCPKTEEAKRKQIAIKVD